MSDLIIKEVEFNGAQLIAAQDKETGKINVGVSWICNGMGLTKSQKDTQVEKIQTDMVLKQGCRKFPAGVFDPNNETLAIELDFLPLWLAKISITPKMQEEQPAITEKLIDYQLKAKDVLAAAFLKTETYSTEPYQKKSTSVGEVTNLIKILRVIMKDEKHLPEDIANMAQMICNQFNVVLPHNFVKKPPFEQISLTITFGNS